MAQKHINENNIGRNEKKKRFKTPHTGTGTQQMERKNNSNKNGTVKKEKNNDSKHRYKTKKLHIGKNCTGKNERK
jgi:hypothetical protein